MQLYQRGATDLHARASASIFFQKNLGHMSAVSA